MNKDKIRLSGLINESLVNGDGYRRVFFSQGCTHNCKGCFNKATHPFEGGTLCNINNLVENVVYCNYLSGVTFSGGDPFQQPEAFFIFARRLKEHNINIWSYTGYTIEEIMKDKNNIRYKLLTHIDVLVDGKFNEELKDENLKFRGSSNQRIIDVQQTLTKGEIILWEGKN